jgi:hypothetical protein
MGGMPAGVPPRFLFIPVSGPGGAGEYFRSLAIAHGLEARWPAARIRFVLSRDARYAAGAPYPVLWIDDSPTRASDAVIRHLRDESPDVVFFDSSGRLAQYRAARAAGASVVYISSRPKTRWKGFRWRRMRALDQHWIASPAFLGGAANAWERWKLRLAAGPELLLLDSLYDDVDLRGTRSVQHTLGLERGRYVVVCPGGGGTFGSGPDAARIFQEAALDLARDADMPVLAIVGPRLFAERAPQPGAPTHMNILDSVPNGVLIGLLRDAAAAVVNGGSLLLQAMSLCVPIVAAPIAGDQLARIGRCARKGLVVAAPLEHGAIAHATRSVLRDTAAREQLQARLQRLGLRNGVETAAAAVARLLRARAGARP